MVKVRRAPKNREQDENKRKKNKKTLYSLAFIAINIGIIAYIAIREFGADARGVMSAPRVQFNGFYLFAAAACFGTALLMESLKYAAMIRAMDGRPDPRGAFECAALGKYYDNITPSGAGGQPFQVIYLKKRGYSTGTSAALPIAGFIMLQLAFVMVALLVFVFNGSVANDVPAIRIAAYIGLAFYLFVPVCIILFSVMPKTLGRMISGVVKLLYRFHIVKDYDKAISGVFRSLTGYCESLQLLSKKSHLLGKTFLYSIIYQVAILSIPFFVLHAFGGTNSWISVFSLVVYIYAAITVIPTPGNSGAAEGSFYAVFSSLTGGYLFWAVLMWRLMCYYSWLLLGVILLGLKSIRFKKKHVKRPIPKGTPTAAQFVDVFYPTIDGAIRTVYSYAKRLNRDSFSCVVCPKATTKYRDEFDFDVVRVPALHVPGVAYLLPLPAFSHQLKTYLTENHFDVFHAHSPFTMGRYAVRMGRKLGVPVVATFHSKYYDDVLNITHSKLFARLVTNWIVQFYQSADAVWTCSNGTAETLRSYGYRGEITVVDNGIDSMQASNPEMLKARAVTELSLPENKHILLFVGHQIWQKNLKLVLDVAEILKKMSGDYLTVIAGCGYNQKNIVEYAEQLNLGDSIRFVGQISDRELLKGLLLASNLFFFPSVYDNAPLVVREAAAMGLPSLLVKGSNAAERIVDGENGFTEENNSIKMARKIQDIFHNCDLAEVGANAQKTIPISWDDIVAEVEENYKKVEERCCEPTATSKDVEGKVLPA